MYEMLQLLKFIIVIVSGARNLSQLLFDLLIFYTFHIFWKNFWNEGCSEQINYKFCWFKYFSITCQINFTLQIIKKNHYSFVKCFSYQVFQIYSGNFCVEIISTLQVYRFGLSFDIHQKSLIICWYAEKYINKPVILKILIAQPKANTAICRILTTVERVRKGQSYIIATFIRSSVRRKLFFIFQIKSLLFTLNCCINVNLIFVIRKTLPYNIFLQVKSGLHCECLIIFWMITRNLELLQESRDITAAIYHSIRPVNHGVLACYYQAHHYGDKKQRNCGEHHLFDIKNLLYFVIQILFYFNQMLCQINRKNRNQKLMNTYIIKDNYNYQLNKKIMEAQGELNSDRKNEHSDFQKFWMTEQQMYYLSTLMPNGYSFCPLQKSSKRGPKKGFRVKQIEKNQSEFGKGSQSGHYGSVRVKKTPSNMLYNQNLEKELSTRPNTNRKYNDDFYDEELKSCSRILNLLKNSRTSFHFREPVDPVALGVPNYYEIVQQPMDLQTIENNLKSNLYKTATQFHADINKIIRNSLVFNNNNEAFIKITQQFQNYYLKVMADSNPTRKARDPNKLSSQTDLKSQDSRQQKNHRKPGRKARKVSLNSNSMKKDEAHQKMVSFAQKQQIIDNIRRLNKQDLRGLVKIIYPDQSMIKDTFDIEELDQQKLIQVQFYVRNKVAFPSQVSISHSHGEINFKKSNHSYAHQQSSFEVENSDQSD